MIECSKAIEEASNERMKTISQAQKGVKTKTERMDMLS
jgi:hypothetical protein